MDVIQEARRMRERVIRLTKLYLEGKIHFTRQQGARIRCYHCGRKGKEQALELCDVDELPTCRRCFERLYTTLDVPDDDDRPRRRTVKGKSRTAKRRS